MTDHKEPLPYSFEWAQTNTQKDFDKLSYEQIIEWLDGYRQLMAEVHTRNPPHPSTPPVFYP